MIKVTNFGLWSLDIDISPTLGPLVPSPLFNKFMFANIKKRIVQTLANEA